MKNRIIKMEDLEVIALAVEVLSSGGVLMHPTETCYGFAVDVTNEFALRKLYELKGRDGGKPLSILVSDLEMAQQYGNFSGMALRLAERYWPGPLTIVVPSGENFVGIRCSAHLFAKELVTSFAGAITTTSANLSGMPPLYEARLEAFADKVDLIDLLVDGGPLLQNSPSTVVKVVGDDFQILRQGDLQIQL